MITRTPSGRGLGRAPDLGDIRDLKTSIFLPEFTPAPPEIDLRPGLTPIGDQGALGSCTAWATLAAWRFARKQQGLPDQDGSELAQYYWSRLLTGDIAEDAGATIRDAMKAAAKFGVAPEDLWPYDPAKFSQAPTKPARQAAIKAQVLQYSRVPQDMSHLRAALARKFVVVFGISVYSSFEDVPQGSIPLPSPDEMLLGGHAITLVGYHDPTRTAIIRNQWGTSWGDAGYGYMSYDYLEHPDLASDLWIISRLES